MSLQSESAAPAADAESKTNAELREAAISRMINVAIQLIARNGASRLSLVDVGREAGYSHSLPNYYFKSKTRLLLQVYQFIVDRFRRRFAQWSREHSPVRVRPGLTNLEATVRAYVGMAGADPVPSRALHILWGESFSSMPELQQMARPINAESVAAFAAQVRIGIARGEIASDVDPEMFGLILLGTLRGVTAQSLIDPEHVDLPALGEMLIRIFRQGIAAPAAPAGAAAPDAPDALDAPDAAAPAPMPPD